MNTGTWYVATCSRSAARSSKNRCCTTAETGRYSTTVMQEKRPELIRVQVCSNVDDEATATGDRVTHSVLTMATPPWLVDMSSTTRGRGRSTTLKPALRRRQTHTLSASCHVSVRQSTSNRRSRMISMTSSDLLSSERTFRHPNVTLEQLVGKIETETCGDVADARWSCTRRPARQPRRRTSCQPDDWRSKRHGAHRPRDRSLFFSHCGHCGGA